MCRVYFKGLYIPHARTSKWSRKTPPANLYNLHEKLHEKSVAKNKN
jgi:hypothetical protein